MSVLALKQLERELIDNEFTKKVVKSNWTQHIQNILDTAFKVASLIVSQQANVLIYCPIGNSGTPLLTSLTQIICDAHYRTFDGLKTLIHKEWSFY
jgi:hypothetical protein